MAGAFVANGDAAVATEPGDRPFDLPPVAVEPFAGLDALAGDPGRDPAVAQESAQVVAVVGLVGTQLVRLAAPWAASGTDRGSR